MKATRYHAGLLALSLGGALFSGCAGTSPNLTAPQMNTPQLNGGLASRMPAGRAAMAAENAEANLLPLEPIEAPEKTFLVEPYLQLGNRPKLARDEGFDLLWHVPADTKLDDWLVETRASAGGTWTKISGKLATRTVSIPGVEKLPSHLVVTAPLEKLKPGALFDYKISRGGKPVFSARARARRKTEDPFRFVVFGDCGANSAAQKKIAYQTSLAKPEFVFVTGDIIYDRGRASEYVNNYWPIYNADKPAEDKGAPLLRSIPFLASPGNHDIRSTTLEKHPDAMAYFYYWSQPLNGPSFTPGQKGIPPLGADDKIAKPFMDAAGTNYPRMANFSFDYGDTHWTVLDANYYTNWTDPALRAWVEKDLAAAKKSTWRFVAFHQPPFQSNKEHFEDQWMRVLADLFEKYDVTIVWSGHVHNYQRTFPLKFTVEKPRDDKGMVAGKFDLDTTFDGKTKTKFSGHPIYIVSGAGGAPLYDKLQDEKLQPFTAKYEAKIHSLTVVDVNKKTLTIKQIGADGKEIDSFMVTK